MTERVRLARSAGNWRKPHSTIRFPSKRKKKVSTSTVTSWKIAENTPTVTEVSALAASPRRFGSFLASLLSFSVTWYLLSYLRTVWFLRRSCT